LAVATAPNAPRIVLRTSRGRRLRDNAARWILIAGAVTTFVVTILIIGTLAFDAWDFIRQVAVAKPGLGWQIVLVLAGAALASIGVSRFTARTFSSSFLVRRLAGPLAFAGIAFVGFTAVGAWRMFNRLATEITALGWFPRRGMFDISTLIVGTFVVAGIAMLVAVPLGIGAAIYLAEYAKPRVRRVVKPILEILAGIPSIVLAYFAIAFINPNLVVRFFASADRAFTILAAGIAVGILTIPIIASVTEDALRAVPMSLREASFGLGAQRAQTTFRVVFPAAISGIVAALILGVSRAIGETMVVSLAAGAVGGALFHLTPLSPGQTMTAAMAGLSFGSDQIAGNNAAYQSLYFIGALLFVMTLGLNVLGDKLVDRVREVY
jgi:phosphate transport system permease protein